MKSNKDKWGRTRKFKKKIIECKYKYCTRGENGKKKKFLQRTYNHEFCADDHRVAENSRISGRLKKKREKKLVRKCSKCKSGKVPPGFRYLCPTCYRNSGDNYFDDSCMVHAKF